MGGTSRRLAGVADRDRVPAAAATRPDPPDGPEQWTAGTLFPRAAKKIARALNASAGRRPMVVLANLAGFDGSPESLREWQLEFGAEIARAVVNFDGPIVFCVLSRYHGGAFVVFSQSLNPSLEAVALEGASASVIGGATAAAVVFAGEVERAAAGDERIEVLDQAIAAAEGAERQQLRLAEPPNGNRCWRRGGESSPSGSTRSTASRGPSVGRLGEAEPSRSTRCAAS